MMGTCSVCGMENAELDEQGQHINCPGASSTGDMGGDSMPTPETPA